MAKGLSRARELELANRIQAGLAAGASQEAIRDGISARNELVEANLGLTGRAVKPFLGSGMAFDDLCQHAAVELIRASEAFNPGVHGTKFSTFAGHVMKNGLSKSVAAETGFFAYTRRDHSRMRAVRAALPHSRGVPLASEVAEAMGVPMWAAWRTVASMRSRYIAFGSMDSVTDPGGGGGDADEEAFVARMIAEVSRLDPRRREVIERRFGLRSGVMEHLDAIGRDLGRTRERVWQMEREALVKLRTRLTTTNDLGRVLEEARTGGC